MVWRQIEKFDDRSDLKMIILIIFMILKGHYLVIFSQNGQKWPFVRAARSLLAQFEQGNAAGVFTF